MTLEVAPDITQELAAEDTAIERVGTELLKLHIEPERIKDIQTTLRHQPGPIVAEDFSILADPEEIWKVIPHHPDTQEMRPAA